MDVSVSLSSFIFNAVSVFYTASHEMFENNLIVSFLFHRKIFQKQFLRISNVFVIILVEISLLLSYQIWDDLLTSLPIFLHLIPQMINNLNLINQRIIRMKCVLCYNPNEALWGAERGRLCCSAFEVSHVYAVVLCLIHVALCEAALSDAQFAAF